MHKDWIMGHNIIFRCISSSGQHSEVDNEILPYFGMWHLTHNGGQHHKPRANRLANGMPDGFAEVRLPLPILTKYFNGVGADHSGSQEHATTALVWCSWKSIETCEAGDAEHDNWTNPFCTCSAVSLTFALDAGLSMHLIDTWTRCHI